MHTPTAQEVPSHLSPADLKPRFSAGRTVRYIGSVSGAVNERALQEISGLVSDSPRDEIALFVTSTGGPTGMAMSFFDTLRHIIRPNLTTIGSGDVDSSGIIIFLSGKRRYVTKNTTLLLHPAGRAFGASQRFTAREMGAMLAEDTLKDAQYAALVAEGSRGKLTQAEVAGMMEAQTVLDPVRLVELGLADAVLE